MVSELSKNQAFMILNALPQVGPITLNRLLQAFGGDPRAVLGAEAAQLESVRGVGPAFSASIAGWRQHFDLPQEEARMSAHRVVFVPTMEDGYPPLLREIHDPPIGLYRKGNYLCDRPSVAIVGSRRTTLYGQTVAKKLAEELARMGYCVASGLARGIDTAAHEGALAAGGRTVAVLGNGIDLIYPPENLALYRQIEEQGAVLTEFPFARRADRQSFAMRNRIVAGMCVALIVVESDVDGGSMITAKFAADQGRIVFAVPGRIDQPTSAGCHQLIRDGAVLLTRVDDVVSELSYLNGMRPQPIPGNVARGVPGPDPGPDGWSDEERGVLGCFSGGALLGIDELAFLLGRPVASVAVTLMRLELRRRLVKRADGRYESVGGD